MISSRVPVTISPHFLRGLLMAIWELKALVHKTGLGSKSNYMNFRLTTYCIFGKEAGLTHGIQCFAYTMHPSAGIFESKDATNEYTVIYKWPSLLSNHDPNLPCLGNPLVPSRTPKVSLHSRPSSPSHRPSVHQRFPFSEPLAYIIDLSPLPQPWALPLLLSWRCIDAQAPVLGSIVVSDSEVVQRGGSSNVGEPVAGRVSAGWGWGDEWDSTEWGLS